MRRAATSAFLIAGTVWLLTGCRADFTEETAAVESMLRVLDAVDARVAALDTVAVQEKLEQVGFECDQFRLSYLDTSQADFRVRLDSLCGYSVQARQTMQRTTVLSSELRNTRKQLTDLRADLQHHRVKEDVVATFIEIEFLYVESLSELMDELEEQFEGDEERYSDYRFSMDSLLNITSESAIE